jgi:hypothetical protein
VLAVHTSGYRKKVAEAGHRKKVAEAGHRKKIAEAGHRKKVAEAGNRKKVAEAGHRKKVAEAVFDEACLLTTKGNFWPHSLPRSCYALSSVQKGDKKIHSGY